LHESELIAWGERIGQEAQRPVVLALYGDVGVGKSVLARAVARGAGVRGPIPSPTFNLVFRYDTPDGCISHLDLYRLSRPSEVWDLGWRELGAEGEIVVVEWAERAALLLPETRWDVTLARMPDDTMRRVVHAVPRGNPPLIPEP
jgi:tRNA threonylcarbamoyladenosine biosynthesis protein TsaE